ncbi:MAG TPA: thioredoxin domain-containing protein [Candidatus Paceibacterota bacterium]
MKKGVLIFWGIILLLIVLGVLSSFLVSARPNKLDSFAQCIKDSGAIFYGAFWCPHCQATKGMFGSAAKLLPYIECSTPDGSGQLPVCKEKGVNNYPTWVFPDGSILTGERTLQELSEKTNCPLPA